ncbi:MAG: hypothetical protein AB7Q30_23085 [Vicinamibacteria bacterium]
MGEHVGAGGRPAMTPPTDSTERERLGPMDALGRLTRMAFRRALAAGTTGGDDRRASDRRIGAERRQDKRRTFDLATAVTVAINAEPDAELAALVHNVTRERFKHLGEVRKGERSHMPRWNELDEANREIIRERVRVERDELTVEILAEIRSQQGAGA